MCRGPAKGVPWGHACSALCLHEPKHVPFLAAGCSPQMPRGPAALPWPLQISCGELEAESKLWLHCKWFWGAMSHLIPACSGLAAG